jgi:GTP-binding protein Era
MASEPSPSSFRFVSGFVSILGRPNTGKSTLLNALLQTKVAIVSSRPQTTRTSIQGVLHLPEGQVIFLDTPGIHAPDSPINMRMMKEVRTALEDRDLLLFLADCTVPFKEADHRAVDLVKHSRSPCILLLNKVDRLQDKSLLLPLIDRYRSLPHFEECIPISALIGEGLDIVRKAILERLPEGPPYFPPDHLTDQPERFLAAELVREKILAETREEVPHAVLVLIDRWEETPRLNRIAATIYVEREGQKGILIGARGSMLKRVGTLAREELERLLGRKVFLELFVKVRPKWRENPEYLNAIDWRSMRG